MNMIIQLCYLVTAVLLILGIRAMSSPKTAKQGILVAGWGMLIAIIVTLFLPSLNGQMNYALIIAGILLGTGIGWYTARNVIMIDVPQMIALYNGMGGGAASAIAVIELSHYNSIPLSVRILAVLGAVIGSIAFSGSIIAFAKLRESLKGVVILPHHGLINGLLLLIALALGGFCLFSTGLSNVIALLSFFTILLMLGISVTLPIGGANMPIVISLFNAMTGLAVGFNGLVLDNFALTVAGTVVGASGTMLTQLMAKAMNQSITSILFTSPKVGADNSALGAGAQKSMEINDAGILLAFATKVIIVPGYGMAVAQAQHKIWEIAKQLEERGVQVKFAIHPVAGRMPGHMNVLLAEAGVPYDKLIDLEEINAEFSHADVVLIIGANDVVNPSAKTDQSSPIYGMPILEVVNAQNVLVIKRGQGKGFSGVENGLFIMNNTHMLYGDGQAVVNQLVQAIKQI